MKKSRVLRKKKGTRIKEKPPVPENSLFSFGVLKDMGVKAAIICAASVFIGLAYTGLRAVSGIDAKPQAIASTAAEEAAPTPVPVKPVPAKFKYLLKDVKSKEEIPKIHIEEAAVLFESGKAVFIDARSLQEYNLSHIPGSIHMMTGEVQNKLPALADALKGKVLIPYCHGAGCHLSDKVAHLLFDAGYKKLAIFFGGWPEWTQANMPVKEYEPPQQYRHLFEEASSEKEIREITLEEVKFLYDNQLANIIDVDFPDKYNEKHIDRAVSMPVDQVDRMLPGYANFLSQKPVVLYCHGRGGKSKKVSETLYRAGYKKIMVFINALPQWEKAGYPVRPPQAQGR
ncbi:MAG TPA: hypothetical protein ENN43_05660 [bacterium]|nr:hypothetical protein [bacterium]